MIEMLFMSAFLELMTIVEVAFFAAIIGAWSYVYVVLQGPGEIFSWVPNLVNRLISLGKHNALESWNKNIVQYTLSKWIYDCPICHAGFFATWFYPLMSGAVNYSVAHHFSFIVIAIFTAIKLNNEQN